MADDKYRIEIEIKTKAEEALNATKELRSMFQGFYMELGAMGARLATQIPNVLSASIKAFGEEEVAVQKLSAAIRANGGDVSAVVPIFKEFASEMQRATVFADDQILAIQGVATSTGVLPEQMQQVIQSFSF